MQTSRKNKKNKNYVKNGELIMKHFYTLWISNKNNERPVLMETEDTFFIKQLAFNRAKALINEIGPDGDTHIYVRKITIGSRVCTQWMF